MPRFFADALMRIGCEFFQSLGSSDQEAHTIANHLVESNLFGHDSHGILKCDLYANMVEWGVVAPNRKPEVVRESPCTATVDGHQGFGAVGATLGTQLAIEKAKKHGLASVAVKEVGHLGRAGHYALLAAREGLVCQVNVNSGGPHFLVAPYGSNEGRLSTNPIAFCAPRRDADPIMIDMASSSAAEGKVRVALYNGQPIPEGWIYDREGNPSTDPASYYDEDGRPAGGIMPLGGVSAHKGYCLSFMMEMMAGALGGEGCSVPDKKKLPRNGMVVTAWNIDHFTDREEFFDNVERSVDYVKASRRLPGVDEILVPGEPEFRCEKHRREHGIEIDDTTWASICRHGRSNNADVTGWETLAS